MKPNLRAQVPIGLCSSLRAIQLQVGTGGGEMTDDVQWQLACSFAQASVIPFPLGAVFH